MLIDSDPGPFITSSMVIAEAAYLINRQLGPDAEAALYEWILDGTLHVEALTIDDWRRVHDLVEQYSDLPLGETDSSLVAIAERLQASRLATSYAMPVCEQRQAMEMCGDSAVSAPVRSRSFDTGLTPCRRPELCPSRLELAS